MKKVVLALIFTLIILLPISAKAAMVTGKIIGVLQFERSPEIDAVLTPEKIKVLGWTRNNFYYQRTIPLYQFSLRIDDETTLIQPSTDAQFRIELNEGSHSLHILDKEGKEIEVREIVIDRIDKEIEVPIVIVNDLKYHGCCTVTKDTTKEATRGVPACLDYNGPYGNCKNYDSWYSWRKYANFVGSDCDYAMGIGYCWNELMPGVSCNHGNTNCSPLIGHSQSHHCH